MKKIVLPINALEFNENILDFVADVVGSSSEVTGLFINDTSVIGDVPGVKMMVGQAYVEEIVHSPEEQKEIENNIQKNISVFLDGCSKRGIKCVAKEEKGNPWEIVNKYSRYSDFIIISPQLTFRGDERVPTEFAEDILSHAACPVVLAPEHFVEIHEIIVAFDGSASSIYALKQFCYLLPEYCAKKVTVLHINEDDDKGTALPDEDLFSEWMKLYCPSFSFESLAGDARDVLFNYFVESEDDSNKMLVAGSFGRSAVSRFFKPATTQLVMKAADVPVFIAHH